MKRFVLLSAVVLTLTACGVDTTGISAASSKTPNPKSNVNAVVTVTEYGDLQCPACKGGYERIVKPLLEKDGSKIRFEFKQFPLVNVHQYAMIAAEASECAADQGKFWEFMDLDYTEQDKLSSSIFDTWGPTLGLDMDLFHRCLNSHIKRPAIQAEYDAGVKLGVQGTPTFFVNGTVAPNTIDDIEQAIGDASASAIKNL